MKLKKCWACGSEPIYSKHRKMSGFSESVNCSNEDCWVNCLSISPDDWDKRFEDKPAENGDKDG